MAAAAEKAIVILGGGVGGVSSAYHLAKKGFRNITIVDERPPLSFTSSLSFECYRDIFPKTAMRGFLKNSIDMMEKLGLETDNTFGMSRTGYAFFSSRPDFSDKFLDGFLPSPRPEVRYHPTTDAVVSKYPRSIGRLDFRNPAAYEPLHGVDVVNSKSQILSLYPYMSPSVNNLVHARRAGWVSAQTLGMVLYERALQMGVKFVSGTFTSLTTSKADNLKNVSLASSIPKVKGVKVLVKGRDGEKKEKELVCDILVNSAGPYTNEVQRRIGKGFEWLIKSKNLTPSYTYPLKCEMIAKIIFRDPKGIVPRDAPVLIWADSIQLPWTAEQKASLEEVLTPRQKTKFLGTLPSGLHLRPYAHDSVLLIWEYYHQDLEVDDPPNAEDLTEKLDPLYIDVAMQGLAQVIPKFENYLETVPCNPTADAGFYCMTPENFPIIGPSLFAKEAWDCLEKQHTGIFTCAGLSHYGIMSSMASGDLLAHHVHQFAHGSGGCTINGFPEETRPYASAFLPSRYLDPKYALELKKLMEGPSGSIG